MTGNNAWAVLAVFLGLVLVQGQASAAITFVVKKDAAGIGTKVTISLDKKVKANDFLLAQIALESSAGCSRIAPPAGWTLLTCDAAAGGLNQVQALFYRVAVKGDAGKKQNWFLSSTLGYVGIIYTYRGVDQLSPIDAGPSVATYTNSKNVSPTDITIQTPGAMAVNLISAGVNKDKLFTPSNGWTERAEKRCKDPCPLTISASDKLYAAPGTTNAINNKLEIQASGIIHLLALRPYALIAYYSLDGINWLADNGGFGYDATAKGTAASTAAKVCTGFLGNGSGWLEVSNNASQTLTSRYAVTAWVKPTAYPASGGLSGIVTKLNNYELYVASDGRLRWHWCESSCSTQRDIYSSAPLPLNQWSHVAVLFDITAAQPQQMYVNGVLSGTGSFNTAAGTTSSSLFIGSASGFTSGAGNRNFQGLIDEVRLYSGSLNAAQLSDDMNATHPCGVDHYRISVNSFGMTCLPEDVTVEVCADANCSDYYTGFANLTLTTTSGSLTPASMSVSGGFGTTSLSKTTVGNATLSISSVLPTASSTFRCFVGGNEVAASACTVAFSNTRLMLDVPDLTACQDEPYVSVLAEKCGSVINGAQNVRMWATYSVPSTGTKNPVVNGISLPNASPGSAVPVIFDANGEATVTLNYADAGQVTLNAEATVGSDTLKGNSNFVSVPDRLLVYSEEASAVCTPASSSCSTFKRAGEAFPLKIKAACWEAAPSANPVAAPETPNFMLSGLSIAHSLIAPSAGSAGALGVTGFTFTAPDKGIATVMQSVSEVGVFQFSVTSPDYFDNAIPPAISANIGRFVPHHLRTEVTSGCGGFTYSEQPFAATVRALNLADLPTVNYDSSFGYAKATVLTEAAGAAGSLSQNNVPSTAFMAGVGAVNPVFTFTTKQTPPATITVRATDSDAVSSSGYGEGSTSIRSGRLRLGNAYGSELLDLMMPLTLEYWQDSSAGWKPNTADGCTSLSASQFSFSYHPGNLAACETALNLAGAAPAYTLRLKTPGVGNDGTADVWPNLGASASGNVCTAVGGGGPAASPALQPWLQFDWNGDGVHTDNPVARIVFGIYKSNLIDLRERY